MMHLNIIHRTGTGHGYELYRQEQDLVHSLGLKATASLFYTDLFDDAVVADAFRDRDEHGDEISLSLHGIEGPGITGVDGQVIWLLPLEKKREVLRTILAKFKAVIGHMPTSVSSHHLDASTMRVLKEIAPEIETVVGGCFEEGVRVFHGCNHSWYLFNEGMPWDPWYPSSTHALRPAADEADSLGLVAVPHLMRDMSLSYEGRNDFWASHPPNIIRGMGNDASFCPYDLNLIDQYRMQEKWNGGYSYYNTYVSVNWLTWNINSEYPPEVAWELYTNFLKYLAKLKKEGQVLDSTLTEYGRWHRQHRPLGASHTYWAKEMLYGSGKHYYWFIDSTRRILIDATQGGAIGDLRPYTGKVPVSTGPDTPHRENGSYPYLIQSQYRSGASHHWHDGTRTTLLLTHGKETIDICTLRAKIANVDHTPQANNTGGSTVVTLTPVQFRFPSGLEGQLTTRYHFLPDGITEIERTISGLSSSNALLTLAEYVKAAPGRTEYPVDMHGITLSLDGLNPATVAYDYSGSEHISPNATTAAATVPHVNTRITLTTPVAAAESGKSATAISAAVRVGHLFTPYFTLILNHQLQGNGTTRTCLNLTPLEK